MRTFKEILEDEQVSLKQHARKYWLYFAFQVLILGVAGVSGSINAFAQSTAAQGTPYVSPDLLFWTGILSAVTALPLGLGLTLEVSKQKSRRDFHRLMVGKLERKRITAKEAERTIGEYFDRWRD